MPRWTMMLSFWSAIGRSAAGYVAGDWSSLRRHDAREGGAHDAGGQQARRTRCAVSASGAH
eukprot:2746185-Prymnesium_polylepis.1